MSRPRNPRRLVLDAIDTPVKRLKWIKSHWTVRAVTYDAALLADGSNPMRPRRPDEYPENTVTSWGNLHDQLEATIKELTQIRDYAAKQYYRLADQNDPS